MLKTILILFSLLCCGCSLFTPSNNHITIPQEISEMYDINSLTDSDKTFRICHTNTIRVYDGDVKTNLFFTTDWFIVNKDLLKTFNENQDFILQLSKKHHRNFIIVICMFIAILIMLVLVILR